MYHNRMPLGRVRSPVSPPRRRAAFARLLALAQLVLGVLVVAAGDAAAQVRVVDEGTFTILRGGARAGREDFSIRTTADSRAGVIAAQATVAIGDRRLSPALGAQANGAVATYQLEVRDRAIVADQWVLEVTGVRAAVRHRTASEDAKSEFPAAGAPALLDDDIAHHLWFVLRRAGTAPTGTTVPVVRLRDGAVRAAAVSAPTDDARTIGGVSVAARRREVRLSDGTAWMVWTDASDRLLEVAMPRAGLRFVRDDPPPSP